MLKTMQKHGVTLAIFAAALTGLTALVNELTKTTIAEQAMKQQKALFDQVIPSDLYDNDLQKSCFVVQAPQLGKGPHRVYIARKGDNPVGAAAAARRPRSAGCIINHPATGIGLSADGRHAGHSRHPF